MVQKLQITFLWIAAFLLLAHQFVPHHHHVSEDDHCAIELEHSNHNHTAEFTDLGSCHCSDNANSADCELDLKTLKKQATQLSYYMVAFGFFIQNTPEQAQKKFFTNNEWFIHHCYFDSHTLRGPPQS